MGLLDSITGGLFGKKPTPVYNPTQYGTLPDFGKTFLQDILKAGQGITDANGLRLGQMEALTQLERGVPAPAGIPNFNFGQKADSTFGRAGSMFDIASGYLQQGASPVTSADITSGISDFMNPHEDQVVANTVRDVQKYGSGLFSDARGLISDAGVTGSNRERLLAGDIADNLTRTVGDVSSSLRSSGFQSAAQNALQRIMGDRNRALTAGGTQSGVASGMVGLGNEYLQGRQLMENIRQGGRTANREDLLARVDAGQAIRGVPLENLKILADLFRLIPVGGGNVASMRENPGFLGRAANIAGTFMGAMKGMAP